MKSFSKQKKQKKYFIHNSFIFENFFNINELLLNNIKDNIIL